MDVLLSSLRKALDTDSITERNVEEIIKAMETYESNEEEWDKYAHWNGDRYTRNLVDDGNGKYNILILCWPPGIKSAIHDHPNSHCVMKILKGEMVERRFIYPETSPSKSPSSLSSANSLNSVVDEDGNRMKQKSARALERNKVSYMHDQFGVHQMCNDSESGAVSLHIYSPPIPACKIFDADSGDAKQVDSSRIDSRNCTPVLCIDPEAAAIQSK